MIGTTLGFYFGRIFASRILGLFAALSLLVFLIDFLEVVRSNATDPNFSIGAMAAISALRVPVITEQIIPFAVLLGALWSFMVLSSRIELAIGRAAGLSVWQFSFPGVVVAGFIGIVATTVYNPLAVNLRQASDAIANEVLGDHNRAQSQSADSAWAQQKTDFGHSVLHVNGLSADGAQIFSPTLWDFDTSGRMLRRIDATSGTLDAGAWHLKNVLRAEAANGRIEHLPSLDIATTMTASQIRESLGSPDTISFWSLSDTIARAKDSSLPAFRFRVKFQEHISRPLLLMSMVGLAAAVGLGLSRSGGQGLRILGGIAAGFVLYVNSKIASDLGGAGLVSPELAAWTPAFVASLFGVTVLLYREDG